ncbi:EAL domain-containing protein [Deefgea piscis]|uniref:EAL domain-containing protein n=1 Tax=Deefgea piscis TaxID=2739061 RepID=UPI001C7F714D|nr:EAL domain-containing protein [Deefgea piscis]QZA81826.1 EAL domain-containing protein [Deefgea piscis]
MTLLKQLILMIVLLFSVLFCGSIYLNIQSSRSFLTEQLSTISQDTATSLGMQLSPLILDPQQRVIVQSMLDAVFDSGYYRKIQIVDVNGIVILERIAPLHVNQVPDWFVRLFPIETPSGEALMNHGWQQAGSIRIAANPGIAYASLWGSSVNAFYWFLAAFILTLCVAISLLHVVLRPLRAVEMQAMAICNREYPAPSPLPWTLDLRRVVQAMNQMTQKLKEMFVEQMASIDRLRQDAYLDRLTGLPNRRYFDLHFQQILAADEALAYRALLFLEVSHLNALNEQQGFQTVDALLIAIADLLKTNLANSAEDSFIARMSGNTFACLIADAESEQVAQIASDLMQQLSTLNEQGLTPYAQIGHIGVVMYHSQTGSEWLSEVDLALRTAQAAGTNTFYLDEGQDKNTLATRNATQWRDLLQTTLTQQNIELDTQRVKALDGQSLHHEVFARIRDADGELIPAALFIPMAKRHGLLPQFDRLVIDRCLTQMAAAPPQTRLAINLFGISIADAEFMAWLGDRLIATPHLAQRLSFELAEHEAIHQLSDVAGFIDKMTPLQVQVGLDNVGRGLSSLAYLSRLKVNYLKVDGAFSQQIDHNRDHQFYMDAMIKIAHGLDFMVIAKSVETAAEQATLAAMRIDGVQGFIVEEIMRWDVA